eukprot:CAMPEP_0172483426 /NCGR_PEP_ID=MMETSP1066-20121228/10459_1 /TAXON_ID=671091 /ORGANISM="Coscinodiscus wailesii, Strain CCMP2513" /LENGTH=258 /DNA_ID=CAMNT_0013247315 /DNA_START=242 /DNA_END=1018 /DNA_ORIENTATION=-
MAGGLNKKKGGKQADLARKFAMAKQKKQPKNVSAPSEATAEERKLTPEEIKERNDRQRFDDLLNSEAATQSYMNEFGGGRYLSKQQEEDEVNAIYAGIDQIYEGDPAPTLPFQDLVVPQTEQPLGKGGTEKILPWLKKNDPKDYVIVISDPRPKSTELRKIAKSFTSQLNNEMLQRVIIVNADTCAENRRWVNKNGITVDVYCDEEKEWMKSYTALGKKRWAVCMFILADGKVDKLVRELDGDIAGMVIKNAVESLRL